MKMSPTAALFAEADPRADRSEALLDVYAAARRFVAMQGRADGAARPATLADAIERDFLLFDLHEAGRDLRDAVEAADEVLTRRPTASKASGLAGPVAAAVVVAAAGASGANAGPRGWLRSPAGP